MARTPKAQALGAALRQARGQGTATARTGCDDQEGYRGGVPLGDRRPDPTPEQVAQILTKLEVDGERYDEIMTLAYGTNESQWVAITLPEQRQQMAAYLDWEQGATRIVEVAPMLVPGLLQTTDYIRAIMTAGGVPADEVSLRVTSRIGRREVLTKRNPAQLLVLLGQAALHQDIGGRDAMIGQFDHLLDMAARPNIELRLVPDRRGWHPGLEGAFALIESPRPPSGRRAGTKSASIVFVGTRRSVLMLHEQQDIAAYRQAVDSILAVSLPPEPSANFIAEIRKRMENQ